MSWNSLRRAMHLTQIKGSKYKIYVYSIDTYWVPAMCQAVLGMEQWRWQTTFPLFKKGRIQNMYVYMGACYVCGTVCMCVDEGEK